MPSTYDMSAPDVSRSPSSRYIEYLHAYARRIKRGPAAPPADGAGLLLGARFAGRATPRKGKGLPPLDNVESPMMGGGRRKLPGRSYVETDPLNAGSRPSTPESPFRPCVRAFQSAFASSLDGAGAVVAREEPAHRPVRRHGTKAPPAGVEHTKGRVVIDATHVDAAAEFRAAARRSSLRAWRMPQQRPMVDTIIRHRFSDPATEPALLKLESARMSSPNLSRSKPEATRGAFNTAARDYSANKCRALYGSSFRFE